MGYLSDLKRKIQSVDFEELGKDAFADKEQEHADLVREQMQHGQHADSRDSSGTDLGTYISQDYADNKFRNGLRLVPYGSKDLYDTGSFQRKIVSHIVGDEIITESTDSRAAEILAVENEYSEVTPDMLFSLNGEYKRRYINTDLHPQFKILVEKATGLKYDS